MKKLLCFGLLVACLGATTVDTACAQKTGSVGIRGGIGTDITGGIVYGLQLNYTHWMAQNAFELGLTGFGGSFEETSDNGFNEYVETTDIIVIAAIANYLIRYQLDLNGPYFVVGMGAGAIAVEWEERSDTDTSLGTPLPGGGSMMSEEGTTGGLIINFGIGHRFSELFDLRFQIPVFFISGGEDRDGKVAPAFTLTAGLSF